MLNKNFYKRDVSNFLKLYEDSLKDAIEIDDTYFFNHIITKTIDETFKKEKIVTFIEFVNAKNTKL